MVSSEGSTGYWFVSECDEPQAFICEFPRNGYTNPPTTVTTVLPEAQCESFEWIKYNEHCYRLFTDELSFSNAEAYCQSKGGHLMSIQDTNEEQEALVGLSTEDKFMWIGLRQDDVGQDSGQYWTDGSPVGYLNFKGFLLA